MQPRDEATSSKFSPMDEAVRAVEVQLGIHVGFLDRLLHEDDWSFVVKAHALIDAAVSFLVTRALNEPALSDVISRLRLNDDRTGKMAFVKRLNLLDQRHIRFMRRLSEMRNAFSHGIENVDNTVDEFLRSIDERETPFLSWRILSYAK
jgi:hypothetical protein